MPRKFDIYKAGFNEAWEQSFKEAANRAEKVLQAEREETKRRFKETFHAYKSLEKRGYRPKTRTEIEAAGGSIREGPPTWQEMVEEPEEYMVQKRGIGKAIQFGTPEERAEAKKYNMRISRATKDGAVFSIPYDSEINRDFLELKEKRKALQVLARQIDKAIYDYGSKEEAIKAGAINADSMALYQAYKEGLAEIAGIELEPAKENSITKPESWYLNK